MSATEAQRAAYLAMYAQAGDHPPAPSLTIAECVACQREPHAKHYDAPARRPVLMCDGNCKAPTLHRFVAERPRDMVPAGKTSDQAWQCTACGRERVWGTRELRS